MGLFSKKDPCAICGGKVKGIFPAKIDGQYVCSDCYGIVDLPGDTLNHMNINGFRGYMAFREENNLLREQFQTTQQVDFGWLDTKFLFDIPHRLFCMDKHLNKTIFEGKQIRSFRITEDSSPLFEGSASGLIRYTSTVPDRAMDMVPMINQFRMQMERERRREEMRNSLNNNRDDQDNIQYHPQPHFDIPEPFCNFNVEIQFDHPYWTIATADMKGPTFSSTDPDVNDYLSDYNNQVSTMAELANALMALAFPNAPVQSVNPNAYSSTGYGNAAPFASAGYGNAAPFTSTSYGNTAPSAADPVEEIRRFKALMDQGIITEEEFAEKKRQLLGI